MGSSHQPVEASSPAGRIPFAMRPASTAWENVTLAAAPQCFVWVWVKPTGLPQVLVVRIPDETFEACPREFLTMRNLLVASNIEPESVVMWTAYGVSYEGKNGTSPALDEAIQKPPADANPDIAVCVNVPLVGAAPPEPSVSTGDSVTTEIPLPEIFERIDAEWNACLEIEIQLVALRQRLLDMLATLQGLNRDLNFEERAVATSRDQQDWLDARRWLREASLRILSCVKEYDIGDTSAAGQKKWFKEVYEQYIVPRRPFDGIEKALTGYESYRKMVATLQTQMNGAHLNAVNNGERRAQQVLNVIAAKIREAQNKKNFLGVILDSN